MATYLCVVTMHLTLRYSFKRKRRNIIAEHARPSWLPQRQTPGRVNAVTDWVTLALSDDHSADEMTQAQQLRRDCKLLICRRVRLCLGRGGKKSLKKWNLFYTVSL